MNFSLRNLILVNFFAALLLGAIFGKPTPENVERYNEQVKLINNAKQFSEPLSEAEIEESVRRYRRAMELSNLELLDGELRPIGYVANSAASRMTNATD